MVVCQSKPESLKWVEILQQAIKQSRQPQSNHNSNSSNVSPHFPPWPPQPFPPPYYDLTQWLRRQIISGKMDMAFLRGLLAVRQRTLTTPPLVRPRLKSRGHKAERILFPTERPASQRSKEDSGQFFIILDGNREEEEEENLRCETGISSSVASSTFYTAMSTATEVPSSSFSSVCSASGIRFSVESPTIEECSSAAASSADGWNRLGGESLERICSVTRSLHLQPESGRKVQKTNSAPPELDKSSKPEAAKERKGQDKERESVTCADDSIDPGASLQPCPTRDSGAYPHRLHRCSDAKPPPPEYNAACDLSSSSSYLARSSSISFIDSSSVSSSAFPFCPPVLLEYDEFKRATTEQRGRKPKSKSRCKAQVEKNLCGELMVVPVMGDVRATRILTERLYRSSISPFSPLNEKRTSLSSASSGSTKVSRFSTYVGEEAAPKASLPSVPSFETGCYVTSLSDIRLCCTTDGRRRGEPRDLLTVPPLEPREIPLRIPTYKSTFYAHWSMKAALAVDLGDCLAGDHGGEVVI